MKVPLSTLIRFIITTFLFVIAFFSLWALWDYYMNAPWTRDGRIQADIVQITPDVSGIITHIPIKDNQFVRAGEILIMIDQSRYKLALQKAEAIKNSQKAKMDQAISDANRYHLMKQESVPAIERDQKKAKAEIAKASYEQASLEVELARLNLERTLIKAPTDGYVTNFNLKVGDYANAGHPLFAFIIAKSFYAIGYFEETKLSRIHIGNSVKIGLMGHDKIIEGRVESIAKGIVNRELSKSPNLLANVNPTFSWVRLAQRIPVRISLNKQPLDFLCVSGQTATVHIQPLKEHK